MPDPALVIRVAANLDELRANLREGKEQIETTTAAMGRMASSFQGDRLIQSAHNMVAAINEIGGASKLTEAEQARVNATMEKALEKYAALGREAPAGMRQLANETKAASTTSSELASTVKQLALDFAGMFSARALFNFAKDTVNEASALKDLSNETHINVEELQLLAGAMSEFGVDAETLGRGLYKLSRGIAGGDESVAHGLHLMGMSLKDVEGLHGQELFLKIEAGLATLQGGLRDTTAAELFGGKLGGAMAGASEGIQGAIETWQRFNHVASTESIEALDQYGEAIARASKSLQSYTTDVMGRSAQTFNTFNEALQKGAGWWQTLTAFVQDAFTQQMHFGTGTENTTRLLNDLNLKIEQNVAGHQATAQAHTQVTAAIDHRTAAEKFLAALEADAAVALSTTQLAHLAHLKEIGQLTEKNAAGIGVSTAQLKLYEAGIKAADDAEKVYREFQLQSHAIYMKAMHAEVVEREKALQAQNKVVIDAALEIKAIQDHLADEERQRTMSATDYAIAKATEAAEYRIRTFKGVGEQQRVYEDLIRQELAKTVDQIQGDNVTLIGGAKTVSETAVAGAKDMQQGYQVCFLGASQGFAAFSGGVIQGNQDIVDSIFQVQDAYANVLNPIGTPSALPGLPRPLPRAGGGPVSAGQPYLVGERGPELFVPTRGGSIVPNGGGGVQVAITINGSVLSDEHKIARVVGDAMVSRLKGMGVRLPAA